MLRTGLLHTSALASAFVVSSFAMTSPAHAQAQEPPGAAADPCQLPVDQRPPEVVCASDGNAGADDSVAASGATANQEQAVVVVGSRIRRDRFNGVDPVTVINRDAAVDSGFNSTAEVLQSVGVTGGTAQINDTFSGLVVNGGPGVNTLSLRGLGPNRTLILLNGRRIAPAGTRGSVASADLNVLPTTIVERIEVLNTGASSIYGSDAVAGVVNIVTLSRFNGLAVEADVAAPAIGAGTSQRYAITAGTSGERFAVLGSIEFFNRSRIRQSDQPWARCPQQLRLSPLGINDTDKCFPLEQGGATVNTIGTGFIQLGTNPDPVDLAEGFQANPADYYLLCNRWRPTAVQPGQTLPGFECVGGLLYNYITQSGIGTNLNVRDTFAPEFIAGDIISPTRNYTGYLSATYDTGVFGDGQLYAELLATRRKSKQDAGARQALIDYPTNSPLVAAGLGFTPPALGGGIRTRVFAKYGPYLNSQVQDFVKASVGFRGDLPFAPAWRYDLYAAKSWADGSYTFSSMLADRTQRSLDVVAAPGGGFVCRNTQGGCVAAPILTPDVIAGNFPAAWWDYVHADVTGHTQFREWTTNLTLDGPLFHLPGGAAQAVFGLEYRKSRINDVPSDDAIRSNLLNFSSAPITRGSDSVWEAFTEVEFPILRNVPFAEALTLNASGRYTHYQSYGSGTTYKIGGLYSLTRWLSFRGSYGTSYRAPALAEQFLGATTGFQAATSDPCNDLANVTNPDIRARCLSEGLPNSFRQLNGVTVFQRGGAETGLEAETSKNLTFGAVVQPNLGPAFGNLSLAVDYFKVTVNDGVALLASGTILNGCYANTHPEYCRFITRTPYTGAGSGALSLITSYVNVTTNTVRGIDFNLRYDRELGPGKLDVGVQAVKILDQIQQNDPDSPPFDFVTSIGNPRWSGNGHVGYDWGLWYARWTVDYLKATSDRFITPNLDPAVYDFSVPDYWLHTVSLRFEPNNRYSLTAGIRNLFDRKPPKITAGDPNVNTIANVPLQSAWDFRGRTFFVNAQAKIF